VSPLAEALQEAREQGWCVVSMKQDWNTVFPASKAGSSLGLAAD
jgi:hypothetical protein